MDAKAISRGEYDTHTNAVVQAVEREIETALQAVAKLAETRNGRGA